VFQEDAMTMHAPLEVPAPRSGAAAVPPTTHPVQGPTPHPAQGPVYAGLAVGALAVAGATAVGLRWASRPAAPRTITMGPGGWVSFKGLPPPRTGPPRPWWAVLLRAQRRT
jgi:hypothetical protein